MSKTVDKKRDLRTFCRWSNLSRFTRFWGDQSDHKFAVGGPQLILRAGEMPESKRSFTIDVFPKKKPVAPSSNGMMSSLHQTNGCQLLKAINQSMCTLQCLDWKWYVDC